MNRHDKYGSLAELKRFKRKNIDYRIRSHRVSGSTTAILAPHGGRIEMRTSRLAQAIAGNDFNLYLFEGLQRVCNRDLHITSRFEDRECLSLLESSRVVVTIHGCKGSDRVTYLGGRDVELKDKIGKRLRATGYRAKTGPHQFSGIHPQNICNRGITRAGVQIEFSHGLRKYCNLQKVADAIRGVLLETTAAQRKMQGGR